VFVRRARVLPTPCPATRNLLVLEVSPAPSPCCFDLLFHCAGTGSFYSRTQYILYQRVRICDTRTLVHALQCLCEGRVLFPNFCAYMAIQSSRGKPVSSQINEKLADIIQSLWSNVTPNTDRNSPTLCLEHTEVFASLCLWTFQSDWTWSNVTPN
jgi:hypothetical protein